MTGWGVGELWTSDEAVLAHEFAYGAEPGPSSAGGVPAPPVEDPTRGRVRPAARTSAARASRARAPKGAERPPTDTLAAPSSRVGHGFVPSSSHPAPAPVDPDELVTLFAAFLGGADVALHAIPLDLDGSTPFQHAVGACLRAIPRGEVLSYAELAALAGYPGAQRAVGTFCARNRFALLLPCHRVVASDGIGGYGSTGVAVKRRLLALEGVDL